MAGFFPDVPGPRLAYDRDGTRALRVWNSGDVSDDLPPSFLPGLNTEDSSVYDFGSNFLVLLFPQPVDLVGMMAIVHDKIGTSVNVFQTSQDTTSGADGTWTTVFGSNSQWRKFYDKFVMRDNITPLNQTGISAIRFGQSLGGYNSSSWYCLHLYGQPSEGESPDRLRLWHPTLDQEVDGAYFDWGDLRRSSSGDREFRVKNNSLVYTATAPVVSLAPSTDTTPSVPGQHLLSLDGSAFAFEVTLPDLAPGDVSAPVTLRRATSSGAALSVWWAKILAEAASWEVA